MEFSELFSVGMKHQDSFEVQEEHAAIHVGSGSVKVLATPWMIAFMERVSHRMLAERLPPGYSSVGSMVNVHHLAPTPVNTSIRVEAEILEVNGSRIKLNVSAWDRKEQIGIGEHLRVVIDETRFLKRVESKRDLLQQLKP